MEERVRPPRPPPPVYANQSHDLQLQLPNMGNDTYVVQVPKDQIYRVPPPENARIAELYRNSPERKTKRSRCGCCCFVLISVFIAILVLVGGLVSGLFTMLNVPKDPRFSIQRFLLERGPHLQYNITLDVLNPNSKVGILYKEGGGVTLSLRQREIASGPYPTFYQAHENSTVLGIALKGSREELPKEVDESMRNEKDKVHATFDLTVHVQARTKLGSLLHSGTMNFDVTCQVTVDTLAKATRVLSQQCHTKRH